MRRYNSVPRNTAQGCYNIGASETYVEHKVRHPRCVQNKLERSVCTSLTQLYLNLDIYIYIYIYVSI
jgi:hypothetical protein